MDNKASKNLALFITVSGLVFVINIFSYSARTFSTNSTIFGIPAVVQLVIAFFFLLVLVGLTVVSWRSTIIYQWVQRSFDNARGYWGIVLLLISGLLMDVLVYGSFTFASFRPTLILALITSGLIILKLVYSAKMELRPLFVGLFVFIVESLIIFSVQKFLFPLESYWILLLSGLLIYVVIEWFLIKRYLISNLFVALDFGHVRLVDTLLLILYPLIISSLLSLAGLGMFMFFLPIFWLVCLVHSCSSALVTHLMDRLQNFQFKASHKLWLISFLSVFLIYSVAFFSLKTYPPSYPLFEGGSDTRGTWFTIPVNRSDLFPYGYGRLEDSIFDDLGKPFMAALGQTLGLVEKCEFPGPDTSVVVVSPDPNSVIQPRYVWAVDSMCIQWINTLPGFFWRIGLIGIFLLCLLVGMILKDPLDYGLISLLMLYAWYIWPVPNFIRMGDVAVLVSGMAFIGMIPFLLRRNRSSYLVLWGIVSGYFFGLSGFVRQPCGYALFVTSLLTLIFWGLRQKRMMAMLITSASLLVGYNLIPFSVNGLFMYRDSKLQITAPSISPREHGSGFALLGGLGGKWIEKPSSPEYKNSLDMAFKDSVMWFNLYNENPMISFTQNSLEMTQKTGEILFFRYVVEHPVEFIRIVFQKGISAIILIFSIPINWLPLICLMLCFLGIRYLFMRRGIANTLLSYGRVMEVILIFIVLAIVSTIPAVLTTPYYGHSTYLPSAVLLFTGIFSVYSFFRILISKKMEIKSA